MKAIILAAGQGTRLRPLTDKIPKCMVKFQKKQIIDHILETFYSVGINDIVLVKGYKAEVLNKPGTKTVINNRYDSTNMVASMFCSKEEWTEDIIISYGDIVFNKKTLLTLIDEQHNFSVVVDKNWLKLWEVRMESPINDAETLKLDNNSFLIEIGKKPLSLDQIEGQYIGLIKIKKNIISKISKFYKNLDKKAIYDGKNFDNMFMTSFIQLVIDKLMPVKAVQIKGGWVEIDTVEDLKRLENYKLD